jgi:large subunit ribosomal protein L9|tara:strand:+ start:236 stop:679 length:444 start_codon:yes stop_codon:yes gene_type:complete
MEVIILKEHESLGEIGDIVTVKPGYARNFLFPNGIAVRSSKRNIALVAEHKKTAQKRTDRETAANQELANLLKKVEISIEVEVGDEEKMFGSVTNLDVHKALSEKDIEIDRHSILLDQPIKTLGVHNIPIKLSSGKEQEIKVYVVEA